jgi:hypothetical protein
MSDITNFFCDETIYARKEFRYRQCRLPRTDGSTKCTMHTPQAKERRRAESERYAKRRKEGKQLYWLRHAPTEMLEAELERRRS